MAPILGNEAWGNVTSTYNSAGTRQTALAARQLIDQMTKMCKIDENSYILDLGVGAGAATVEAARAFPSTNILATDVAENMVDFVAKMRIPNVTAQVLDAAEVSRLGNEVFSHVLSTFMLQFMVEPEAAVQGAYQVLKPGGIIGLGIWLDDSDFIVPWEKACYQADPAFQLESHYVDPNAWTTAKELTHHLDKAGFTDIRTSDMYVPFDFPSAEAFAEFIVRGKVPSVAHMTSQYTGDIQRVEEALVEIVRNQYGDGADLRLHALLAIGRKP